MIAKRLLKAVTPQPMRNAIKSSLSQVGHSYRQFQALINRPNVYNLGTNERIGAIYNNPSDMSIDERMFLYTLIRGYRPERALEIGTRHGGSAAIIACAMEDNGKGCIVGVDPAPEITVNKGAFHGRFHLIAKPSPEAVAEAREVAGGAFDFTLIDGIHIHDQVKKDIDASLPCMAEGAYMLFHDAFNFGVREAIQEAVEANENLYDCGYVCTTPEIVGDLLTYAGFRMLRVGASPIVNPLPILEKTYQARGKQLPPLDRNLLNHDAWYCRAIKPCVYCQKNMSNSTENQIEKESHLKAGSDERK